MKKHLQTDRTSSSLYRASTGRKLARQTRRKNSGVAEREQQNL